MLESDNLKNEIVIVPHDAYSLTIAANLTKQCSPLSLIYCIRQCFTVFILQIMTAILFCWQDIGLEKV
jgi:hypothetical protein